MKVNYHPADNEEIVRVQEAEVITFLAGGMSIIHQNKNYFIEMRRVMSVVV